MNCSDTVYTSFSYLCIEMKFLPDNFRKVFVVVVVVVAAVVETFLLAKKIKKKNEEWQKFKTHKNK